MAYKLNSNVTVYRTPEEARAAGVIDKVEQGADGNLYATPHQGWLLRNMPWLVLGTMAVGAGSAALGGSAGATAPATAASGNAGIGLGGPFGFGELTGPMAAENALFGAPQAASLVVPGMKTGFLGDMVTKGVSNKMPIDPRTIANTSNADDGKGGGLPGWLKSLVSPKGALSLASLLPMLTGKGQSGSAGDVLNNPDVQAELANFRKKQAMEAARYERTDPLHQAVTASALARMPIASRPT